MKGQVINQNNYPVVDGNVFVRVSQRNGNYQKEGHFVIDEFFAAEDVVIDTNGTKNIEFEWKVPDSAVTSEYIFDYFFSVGKKFNLGGLPFSNEVIIGQTTFDVIANQQSLISLDRTNVKVNDLSYEHIGSWPRISADEKVVISQHLTNTFAESRDVKVIYELYHWDSLNQIDLRDTQTEDVTVAAANSVNLEYIIPKMDDAVYYLKTTAISGDQKSIINVRIVSNQSNPRLNYPAITKFPLQKNDNFTLFTCFHNGADTPASGKVVVTLLDKKGNVIGDTTYEGGISAEMMVTKSDIVAQNKYEYVKLKAELYDDNNVLVETYETEYDCKDFDNCQILSIGKNIFSVKNILFALTLLLPIIVIVYLINSRRKNRQ